MEKYSKINKKRNDELITNLLFKGDNLTIKSHQNWEVVDTPDNIIILPYLYQYNEILLRKEWVPTYHLASNGASEEWITVISGSMEPNEDQEETLLRELEEEAGIRLRNKGMIEKLGEYFICKHTSSKYHIYYIPLMEMDYDIYYAGGDGSESENKSNTFKININNMEKLNVADTITKLSILLLKEQILLK